MESANPQRVAELRKLISDFLSKRLNDKLEKIKGNSEQAKIDRQKECDRFQIETWLDGAAGRCRQIQVVTHTLKAMHPDLKITEATNLYVTPGEMRVHEVVGSHTLGGDFRDDATGNAAALDVYDFLTQQHQGRTILDMVRANDLDLTRALSEDFDRASDWVRRLAEVVRSPCAKTSSHTLAKQIYWHIGDDPHDDRQYHLLAPLYASSLAQRVWEHIEDDRFGEEAKVARQARSRGDWSNRPVRGGCPEFCV